jgi:hypothetical protein
MDLPFLIVKQYIEEFDKQTDPVKLALQAAEARALTAEACALTAETGAGPHCPVLNLYSFRPHSPQEAQAWRAGVLHLLQTLQDFCKPLAIHEEVRFMF